MIKLIFHKNSRAIKILGPIFSFEFEKYGCETQIIITDDLDNLKGKNIDIFFVFTPHKFKEFKRTGKNKSSVFIAYQQEQLKPDVINNELRINQVKEYADKFDIIIDTDESNIKYLKKIGHTPSFILPTAYHEYFEFKNKINKIIPEYECLFFGRVSDKPRRQKILNKIKDKYSFYPKFENIYDQELEEAVILSKIVLNIHQSINKFPERLRIIIGISNKKLVISEPLDNIKPLIPNKHFVSCSHLEFNSKIKYYLEHKNGYAAITENAYSFVKKSFRMDGFIKEFVQKIVYPIYN